MRCHIDKLKALFVEAAQIAECAHVNTVCEARLHIFNKFLPLEYVQHKKHILRIL